MLANRDPIYIQTPRRGVFRLTAANTAKDGTGVINPLFTGLALTSKGGGSLVERISGIAEAAIAAATALRFFISDTTGANYRLALEIPIPIYPLVAPAAGWTTGNLPGETAPTSQSIRNPWITVNWRLEPGMILGVTCHTTDVIDVHADGGDF